MSGQWDAWNPFPRGVEDALGKDALQAILELAESRRLHAHRCHVCERPECLCRRMPCEFRPFDRAADGRWWVCGFCMMAQEAVAEHWMEAVGAPSGVDLDVMAEEERVKRLTEGEESAT